MTDRFDNDPKGRLDDVVVNDVKMFRLERMDEDSFWIRLYRKPENGHDVVIWMSAVIDEDSAMLLAKHDYDGNALHEGNRQDIANEK